MPGRGAYIAYETCALKWFAEQGYTCLEDIRGCELPDISMDFLPSVRCCAQRIADYAEKVQDDITNGVSERRSKKARADCSVRKICAHLVRNLVHYEDILFPTSSEECPGGARERHARTQ
jgi:hypothetical protein